MPKLKPGTEKAKPQVTPRPRRPDGHAEKEATPEYGPTLVKRLLDDVIPKAKDRRWGMVLGRMLFNGALSEVEVEAGLRYAADVGAYERMKGHPARSSQSPSFEFGRKGADGLDLEALRRMDPEVADKIERRIKKQRKDIQKRYDRAQAQIPHFPILISSLIESVCCNDQPVHSAHHPLVKKILRNLAERVYPDIIKPGDPENARKKATGRKADAVILARSAVDALHEWFNRRQSVITSYRISRPNDQQPMGLTAYGVVTVTGEVIEHTIRLKRSGLMVEAIHAQIVKAAEEKGWPEQEPDEAPASATPEQIAAGISKLKQKETEA